MRVLITGVGGFVGKHLAEQCAEQGAEVLGVGRSPLSGTPFAYEQLDLLDGGAVRELVARYAPERVFHLAALASVAHSWGTPIDVVQSNVTSTLNLLEALRVEAPETLLLTSSSGEEYGAVEPAALPVREDHGLRPQNPYAVSKAMSDLLAGFYADAHGLRVVRARAFNHAGPGQSDTYVVSSFARQIAEAEAAAPEDGRALISTGNAEVRRDFSDVRDVVRAYWLLLERGEAERVQRVQRPCDLRLRHTHAPRGALPALGGAPDRPGPPASGRGDGNQGIARQAKRGHRLAARDRPRSDAARHARVVA